MYVELTGDDKEYKLLSHLNGGKRYHDNKLIGTAYDNPILNTAVYNVENPDGNIAEYTENFIAKNLYRQVYRYGYNYSMLYDIVGHKKTYDTIPMESGYYEDKTGVKTRVNTIKGWKIRVKWESGETSYIVLKDIKNTGPLDIVEYAKLNKIDK